MKASLLTSVLLASAVATLTPTASAQEDVQKRAEKLAERAEDVRREAGALANEVVESRDEARAEGTARRDVVNNNARADHDDGDEGKWGWLGLLGLAGLLGLRRRDHNAHKVDARTDTRL